jgi:DNA-binding transcriptional regulator PaaX
MTTVQHKDEFVTKRQPTATDIAERYAKASAQLRKTIRDDKVYEAANAWAHKMCRMAARFNWPSRPILDARGAGRAAAKLASHLEGIPYWLRDAAEGHSGVKLGVDVTSHAKYLRALAERCRDGAEWDSYGPLFIKFTGKNQGKMPPRAVVLTLALARGFAKIKNKEPFLPIDSCTPIACFEAARLFANAALTIKEQTSMDAVKTWRRNNRGRFKWYQWL